MLPDYTLPDYILFKMTNTHHLFRCLIADAQMRYQEQLYYNGGITNGLAALVSETDETWRSFAQTIGAAYTSRNVHFLCDRYSTLIDMQKSKSYNQVPSAPWV